MRFFKSPVLFLFRPIGAFTAKQPVWGETPAEQKRLPNSKQVFGFNYLLLVSTKNKHEAFLPFFHFRYLYVPVFL